MPGALGSLVAEVARRRVARTVIGYSVAAFGLLQGLDIIVSRLGLPAFWMKLPVVAALAGFPIAAVLAWFFDITPEGVVRTAPLAGRHEATPFQILAVAAALTLAFGVGWLAWRQAAVPDAASAVAEDPLDAALRDLLRRFRADNQQVPPWFRERVRAHINQLLADPKTRSVYYPRLKRYWPLLSRKLAGHGLPEELAYLAWVESRLDPAALSPAGSAGLWQFQPASAREYGLRVDAGHDERLDPALSSEAAARYLANLFAEFGQESFMLAVAAFNTGESKMRKTLFALAQQPGGLRPDDRNFWYLYRLRALPEETMECVPQVLAAAIVCHDPGRYGLE